MSRGISLHRLLDIWYYDYEYLIFFGYILVIGLPFRIEFAY